MEKPAFTKKRRKKENGFKMENAKQLRRTHHTQERFSN